MLHLAELLLFTCYKIVAHIGWKYFDGHHFFFDAIAQLVSCDDTMPFVLRQFRPRDPETGGWIVGYLNIRDASWNCTHKYVSFIIRMYMNR